MSISDYDNDNSSWKEIFFKVNFNVDQCLSTYTQKSDLETLRRELKQYGSELHMSMSEILKTETEAIVYLAENLTNLNSKIDKLSLPVSQLLEEIRSLYDSIRKVQEGFEYALADINKNISESKHAKLQMDMIRSSLYVNNILRLEINEANENLIYLERAVNKYSFQKMYLEETGVQTLDIDLRHTEKELVERINDFFYKALKQSDSYTVTRCLRMYVNLRLQSRAEVFYKEKFARPFLQQIFTLKNLEKHGQKLDEVYKDALHFLNRDMEILSGVLERNPDLKGFNFKINCFWHEVDKQLRENLPDITAPGNPDQFQKRFKETWDFFLQIGAKCNNTQLLKTDGTFQEHIKRFNLPVYFEIRFQQIVTKLEEELLRNAFVYDDSNSEPKFNLKVTKEIWNSMKKCFDGDVFLVLLSDQFLKLFMLILSRYLTWLDSCIPQLKDKDDGGESFLFHLLIDLELLKISLANSSPNLGDTIYGVFPKTMYSLLEECIKVNKELLGTKQGAIQDLIVQTKFKECVNQLAKVDSIPRLYRRTNRNFPKEASGYVVSAVDVLTKFHSKYGEFKTTEIFSSTLDQIVLKITNQYLKHVKEVLSNVCKTEESLRRLKNRNQPFNEETGLGGSETISDEKKIQEQIKLDVGYFKTAVFPFCQETSNQALMKLAGECDI